MSALKTEHDFSREQNIGIARDKGVHCDICGIKGEFFALFDNGNGMTSLWVCADCMDHAHTNLRELRIASRLADSANEPTP